MTSLSQPTNTLHPASPHRVSTSTGVIKGMFAVILFALTVPMTKLALPLFSPELIAASRAFLAGLLALLIIHISGWPIPNKTTIGWLLLAGTGVVIGFPYLLSYSLVNLSATNMGVVLAGLPLITSIFSVVIMKERNSLRFWISSGLGALILVMYFLKGATSAGWDSQTVGILFLVLMFGGLGYSAGAKAAKTIGGWQTICWMLALYLPFSAIAFGYYAGDEVFIGDLNEAWSDSTEQHTLWLSIAGLLYLAVISQWWGFRFWYQAMAEAGAGRISQIQLLQPFLTLLFAAVLLAEGLDVSQLAFAFLIALTIFSALRAKQKE